MGCMGDTPDMAAAATAQGAANKDAAIAENQLNNPNVFAPGYSIQWTGGEDGSRPTKAINLSPTQLDTFNMQQDLIKYATSQMGYNQDRLGEALGGAYVPSGSPQSDFSARYMPNEYYQTEAGIGGAPQLYDTLDYSSASPMPFANKDVRDQVTNSIYQRGAGLLDETYGTRQQQLDSKLSNQGIFTGSNAWGNAQGGLNLQRQKDYNDLAMRAIEQGGQEMARDFGMGLQGRQQSVGELNQQGQFRNQARDQMVNELLSSMSAKNSGINQAFNTALANAGLYNQGRAQQVNEMQQNKLLPINTMLSLFTGAPVNIPQNTAATPSQITPPPLYQGAKDAGNLSALNTGNMLQAGAGVAAATAPSWGPALMSMLATLGS
jgi:hypothetical protein